MRLFPLLTGLLALLTAATAAAQAPAAIDLPARVVAPTDQAQFRRLVLDNGLRVMLVSDPRFNKSAASMVASVGQIDDPREHPGMAHFLEHVVSRGNAKYPGENEFIEYIGRNGGSRNAYTSSDHTNYQFEVRHEALEGALDRLANCFISPAFKTDMLGREVNAVHNESMRYIQDDGRRIFALRRMVYNPASGESKFSTGNKDTLAQADSAAVRRFFESHYSADRMALAITGRASLDDLEKQAREKFSAIPRRTLAPQVREPIFLPRLDALRIVRVEPLRELRQLQLEFVLPATRPMFASRSDRLLASLLEYAGPGGLLQRLKADGLANNLSTGLYERTPAYGSLFVSMDLTPAGEQAYDQVLQQVFGWIAHLRRSPFPRSHFDDLARIGALQETYGNRGEGAPLAVRMANQALFYPLAVAERATTAWGAPSETDYRTLLDALVPENMLAVLAAKGSKTDRREPIYGVAYALQEERGPLYTRLKNAAPAANFALPGANAFMPKSTALVPERAQVLINEPGLALHYAPDTEFQRPQTTVVMRFVPLRSLANARNDALLGLWGQSLGEALQAELADAATAGVQVQPEYSLEGLRLSISGYGDSPARVARQVAARLRNFTLPAARFADVQEQAVRAQSSYGLTEGFMAATDRRQALQREHRTLPDQWLPHTRAARWSDVQAFGQHLLARGRLELLVHGHMLPDDAVEMARALSASIGAAAAPAGELMQRRHLQLAAGETVLDTGLIEGANAVWLADYVLGDDTPRLRMAAVLLGSYVAAPFFGEMRTRQQLGYIASARADASVRERSLGFVVQSSSHPSAELQKRAETFVATLPAALRALTPAEWTALKAGTRSRLEEKPTSIGQRAERLFADAYLNGGDWARTQDSLAALDALTQAEAADLLAQTLSPATARRRLVMLDPISKPPATPIPPSFTDREAWKRERTYR